jgi:hypothetical protein
MKKNKTIDTKKELPNLDQFGQYREGLTSEEITEYLRQVYNIVASKKRKICPPKVINQFVEIAGVNTGALGPNGESLMYRWDVARFVGKLFFKRDTYFD